MATSLQEAWTLALWRFQDPCLQQVALRAGTVRTNARACKARKISAPSRSVFFLARASSSGRSSLATLNSSGIAWLQPAVTLLMYWRMLTD